MDPQLLPPSPAADFNFDSTSTSPYATAPSSPKILFPKFFYTTTSASHHNHSPTNPDDDLRSTDLVETSEAANEQKNDDIDQDNMDFAFDFSGQLEPPSISDADELFVAGKIKSLKPPPPSNETLTSVPKKKMNLESFKRGRERTPANSNTTGHKPSRSLSPARVSDVISSDQKQVSTIQSSLFGFTWYNKWNLKNLLLFRSTSEGSAVITKDVKNSSFRSSNGGGGGGSVGGSSRRMKRKVSAHEIHYTANRAVAEKMRRKTFLPYKSGLLGCCCLGFSQGFNEGSRGR